VEEVTGKVPPKTHDLENLVKTGTLSPDKDMDKFIAEISNLSIVTRYPSDFGRMLKDFSHTRTEMILKKTKALFQWIRKSLAL
jgi:HEPN domain-containing protein